MYERAGWAHSSIPGSLARDLTDSSGEPWIVATVLPEQFHNTATSIYQGRPEAALMHAYSKMRSIVSDMDYGALIDASSA